MSATKKRARTSQKRSSKSRLGKDAPFPLESRKQRNANLYFEKIGFATVYQGNNGPERPIQKVITSEQDLTSKLGKERFLSVDFSKEETIIVALGRKTSSGLTVEIDDIRYLTDRGNGLSPLLTVHFTVKKTNGAARVSACPAHIVKLKQLQGDVEFNS